MKKPSNKGFKQAMNFLPKSTRQTITEVGNVVNSIRKIKNGEVNEKNFREITAAARKVLNSSVRTSYSKDVRAGFLKTRNLFKDTESYAYVENNKVTYNKDERSPLIRKTTLPLSKRGVITKEVEIGVKLSGFFKRMKNALLHQQKDHTLLSSKVDFGNSMNRDKVKFRREELKIRGGFNEKTLTFLGTENHLRYNTW